MYGINLEDVTYTVREPRWAWYVTAPYFLLTLFFAAGTALTWHEGSATRILMIFFCCCFLAPALLMVLAIKKRCLFVLRDGQDYIYRTMFGSTTGFSIHNISCVVLGASGVRGAYLRILDREEQVLCTLEMNMVPVDRLLSDLESKGITIRDEDTSDRVKRGGLSSRLRAEKELALNAMTEEDFHAYAEGSVWLRRASVILQVVSVLLAILVIRFRAVSLDQMSLFFTCWPFVFLVFGFYGRDRFSANERSNLVRQGAPERYIESTVFFPFFGMIVYAVLALRIALLFNGTEEWAALRFGVLEMVVVMLTILLTMRRRISVPAILLLLPLVFVLSISHAVFLNWTLGSKQTETARVERTEAYKDGRNTYYRVYVADGNGETVRYSTTRSIATEKQAGDTVTLVISDSIFGIRQIVVRR